MQLSTLVLAAAALVSSASATVKLGNTQYATITVGTPFNITYLDAEGPVSIILQDGPQTNLKDFITIGSDLPSPAGSTLWTPPSDLPNQQYALKITDGSTTNYAGPFQVIGATAAVSSTSGASSTTGSSASSTDSSSATTTATTTSDSTTATSTGSSTSGSTSGSTSKTASKTSSSTASKTTSTSAPTTSVPGGNSASGLASPLAFVLLALVAALIVN